MDALAKLVQPDTWDHPFHCAVVHSYLGNRQEFVERLDFWRSDRAGSIMGDGIPQGIIPPVINFLIGIWVFISPWVLGYVAHTGMAWSAWIIGALVIILSAWAIAVAQRPGAPVGV